MGMMESLTVRIGADLSGYRSGISEVATQTRGLATKLGAQFTQLRANAAMAGTAIAATLGMVTKKSVEAFSTYEENLAKISTLVDDPTVSIKDLGEAQRAMAKEFGADIGKQMEATYTALSSGVIDATNSVDFMRVASKLAIAGNTDVSTSVDALTAVISAYGKENLDASKASDVLFQIAKRGRGDMEGFAPVFGRTAAAAASANISIEEMGAALATLSQTAPSESEAATQFEGLVKAIVAMPDESKKAAAAIGLDLSAVALSTKGLTGVMTDLGAKLGAEVTNRFIELAKQTSDVSFFQDEFRTKTGLSVEVVAQLFPRIEALRGALGLMANGAKANTENLQAMNEAAGSTDKAFKKVNESAAQDFKRTKAEIHDLTISIGEALAPAVQSLLAQVRPLLEKLAEWIRNNPEQVKGIAEWVVKIAAAGAAIGGIALALLPFIAAIKTLIGIVQIARTVFLLFNVVLLANPIVLIILAIIALVAAIVYLVTHTEILTKAWEFVKEKAKAIWDGIVDFFKGVWERIVGFFNTGLSGVKLIWETVWGGIKDFFSGLWNGIKTAVEDVWLFIKLAFQQGLNFVKDLWDSVWGAISSAFDTVTKAIVKVANWLWDKVKGIFESIGKFFTGVVNFFGGTFTAVKEFLGFSEGGWVPGIGSRDSVPVVATPGEYVVTREAADQYGPLLEMMNAMGGGGGGGTTVHQTFGPLSLSLPGIRDLNAEGARQFSSRLGRLGNKGHRRTDTRGLR